MFVALGTKSLSTLPPNVIVCEVVSPKSTFPLTCKLPVIVAAASTVNNELSKVSCALSSNSPLVPAIIIRLSVRSPTAKLGKLDPDDEAICGTVSVVPSNVNPAASTNAPFAPTNITRPSVRSLTIALASVDSPVTPSVPAIAVSPLADATVSLFAPTTKVVPSYVKFELPLNLPPAAGTTI